MEKPTDFREDDDVHIVLGHTTGREREFPNAFAGMAEDARSAGLLVEETFDEEEPPERRAFASSDAFVWMMVTPWLIFLAQPLYREKIYPWLKRHTSNLWRHFIDPCNGEFPRFYVANRNDIIDHYYSLTFSMMAPLKDGRIAKLLVRDECSEEEFEEAVCGFADFVHRHWAEDEPVAETRFSKQLVLMEYDGSEIRPLVIDHQGNRQNRVEPTIGPKED